MNIYHTKPEVLKQEFFTISQWADLFGVTRQAIHALIARHEVPTQRFGNMIMVKREDVLKFKPVVKNAIIKIEEHGQTQQRTA